MQENQELNNLTNPQEETQKINPTTFNVEENSPIMQTVKYLLKKGITRAERRKLYKITPIKVEPTLGRNEICKCGSGKKYKKCCLSRDERQKTLQKLTNQDQDMGLY